MVATDFYTNDQYLKKNPGWHVEASPWKADTILQIMRRNNIHPKSVCEVGCGAGEILRLLQRELDSDCTFVGYDIAPQAIELAQRRENERLHFKQADFAQEGDLYFDLILLIDVLEHFENCFSFLREIKAKSQYKILQLPLDVSVESVLLNELIDYRHATGHLHFFTKDIALEILRDNGYEVVDYFYAMRPFDVVPWHELRSAPLKAPTMVLKLLRRLLYRLPRKLLFALHRDFAVRLLGGWRMVVLVK